MDKFISTLNDIVWNPALVVLLLAAGLYFSVRTRLVQVRCFGLMLKTLVRKKEGPPRAPWIRCLRVSAASSYRWL